MSYATKEQLAELAAYMASQIRVPTIGIGGGYAPIGTIISYMGTSAPQDYLACDGSVKNIADYPQLADFFESQFGSKNYFGGDGTTTFAVPDLQGEFLRGTGTNSHENQGSGANVGVHQDATELLNQVNAAKNSGGQFAGGNNSGNVTRSASNDDSSYGDYGNYTYQGGNGNPYQSSTSKYGHITTRPTNTSVLYCIKAVVAGDVYSTEERVVGTWLDGKKIYQRTFITNLGTAAAKSNQDVVIVDATTGASLELVNAFGRYIRADGYIMALPLSILDYTTGIINLSILIQQRIDKSIILQYRTYTAMPHTAVVYSTLQYTKTDD